VLEDVKRSLWQKILGFCLILSLAGNGITFYCTKEEMVLLIQKNFTAGAHTDITLRNTSCHADHNQTHFIMRSMFHDCGMSYAQKNDKIIYENVATISPRLPENTLIVRQFHIDKSIELQCIFKQNVTVTTGIFIITGNFRYRTHFLLNNNY